VIEKNMISLIKKIPHKMRRAAVLSRQMINVVQQFKSLSQIEPPRFQINWKDRWIHLRDATSTTAFDKHYIYHTAWAARVLAEINPRQHVDVASSLYFTTSVSAFIKTTFIDFRPAELGLSGLISEAGTLAALPFESNGVESISCMHVVEHVGLGRYGDPLDYNGDIVAAKELQRVLAKSGHLLFVVPVTGVPRIEFNAHRVYSYQQVLDLFPDLVLQEFALIPDDDVADGLIRDADPSLAEQQRYGCGCFHFVKI
jgi:hypothetical protein